MVGSAGREKLTTTRDIYLSATRHQHITSDSNLENY